MEDVHQVRRQLDEAGLVVVEKVLPQPDLLEVKRRLNYLTTHADFYSKHGLRFIPEPTVQGREDLEPFARYAKLEVLLWKDELLWRKIITHPNLVRLTQAVLGPDYCINAGAIFMKPAHHGSPVPWHQDSAAWGLQAGAYETGETPLLFDYWLALERATLENGCLQFIPGSHKLGVVSHTAKKDGELVRTIKPDDFGYDAASIVPVEANAGDLLIWHQDMFHASGPNRSAHSRAAVAGTFISRKDLARMREQRPKDTGLGIPICVEGRPVSLKDPVPATAEP